jgi:colanic acid/amylovoran biosynthesis glycosyltransferase
VKILAYTENYASVTVTFITNELMEVQKKHELVLAYSVRQNAPRYALKNMVEVPFKFNRVINKFRWWLEQSELYYSLINYRFKNQLNKLIADFNPDIIHCHFGTDFLKVAANLNPIFSNKPILISFYGFDVTERIKNKAVVKRYNQLLALPNIYSIAVSKSLVENINKYLKPANDAIVMHSGIDTNFYKRKSYHASEQEFVFLQVSSFNPKKGHKYALEAFKRFIDSNTHYHYKFIIAGFGPSEEDIKSQIIELGLTPHVEMLGSVTPAEMVELSSKANCFVHMSITPENGDQEGLPNVLLEAMSLELPILSTVHAGIPEIVEHGVNGILCEEKNVGQYEAAFHRIVAWKLCPQNREKIIKSFSLESHMKELNDLYTKISKP